MSFKQQKTENKTH